MPWNMRENVGKAFCCLLFLSGMMQCLSAQGPRPCAPRFPLQAGKQEGWQGGDAAYSIPLGQRTDLWIFGDTLVGEQRSMAGKDPRMVHNSLGISRCNPDGSTSMTYLIRKDERGNSTNYFTPRDPTHWYWPMDGVRLGDKLLISLLCLRHPRQAKDPAFNFEACGADLALLHADSDLQNATPKLMPLFPEEAGISSVPTVVSVGRWIYVYAVRSSDSALIVGRLPVGDIGSPARVLEMRDRAGNWSHTVSIETAGAVMDFAPSEMSIRFYSRWKQWLAIYKDPDLLSDRIMMRTSTSATGPWTKPSALFSIQKLDDAAGRKGVFCYAGKDHPELAAAGELMVSYACNTFDPADLIGHDDVYTPKVVRVRLDDALRVTGVQALP